MARVVKQSLKLMEEIGHGYAHRYHRANKNKRSFFGREKAMDRKKYLEGLAIERAERDIKRLKHYHS